MLISGESFNKQSFSFSIVLSSIYGQFEHAQEPSEPGATKNILLGSFFSFGVKYVVQ